MENIQEPKEKWRTTRVSRALVGRVYYRTLQYGLLNVAEVATLLGITSRSVWNLVARHKLHPRRRSGHVLFLLSEVRAFRSSANRRPQA